MRSVATTAAVGAGVGAADFSIVLAAAHWPAVTDVRVAALVAVGARSGAEPLLMLRQAALRIAAALGWDYAGLLLAAPPGQRGARGHHASAGDGPPAAESFIGGPHDECLVKKSVSTGSLVVSPDASHLHSDSIGPGGHRLIVQPIPPIPGMASCVWRFTFDDELGAIPAVSQAERVALEICATLTVVIVNLIDTT